VLSRGFVVLSSGFLCLCPSGVVSNKNLKKIGTMTDTAAISVIATYQQRIAAKAYVPATTYGRPTLGASGVRNKLFLVFLFSEHDVGVEFLKDVGQIPSSMACCRCGSQMSWCFDKSVQDHYRWRWPRAISATACRASISIKHDTWFQQSNLNFMEVLLLTTSFIAFLLTQSAKSISSVLQPLLKKPKSVERSC